MLVVLVVVVVLVAPLVPATILLPSTYRSIKEVVGSITVWKETGRYVVGRGQIRGRTEDVFLMFHSETAINQTISPPRILRKISQYCA